MRNKGEQLDDTSSRQQAVEQLEADKARAIVESDAIQRVDGLALAQRGEREAQRLDDRPWQSWAEQKLQIDQEACEKRMRREAQPAEEKQWSGCRKER